MGTGDAVGRWFRAYVEACLREAWGVPAVVTDADRDFPFRHGMAACWVRIEPGEPMLVRVFGHAATDVKRSASLLAELNDVNARSLAPTVSWHRVGGGPQGLVFVDQALHAEAVTPASLAHACAAVGSVADDIGLLVATMFGGSTPFSPLEEPPLAETPDR